MTTQTMTADQLLAHVAKLTRELEDAKALNDRLKVSAASSAPFLKVSEKGAVSVYRINRQFPVTLYRDQWLKLLDMAGEIKAFIIANEKHLAVKPPKLGRPAQSENAGQ